MDARMNAGDASQQGRSSQARNPFFLCNKKGWATSSCAERSLLHDRFIRLWNRASHVLIIESVVGLLFRAE